MKHSHSHEMAYIRQLCCLGLPKEAFIPELLQAITRVIPSHNNTYIDSNEFKQDELYIPSDNAYLNDTIQPMMKSYWIPCSIRFAAWLKKILALTDYTVIDENYRSSDLYNFILIPLDRHYQLLAFIPDQRKLVGAITLFRLHSQRPFNRNDQALLLRLMPYVSHAFQIQNTHELQYINKGETSMLLMNKAGNILYQNATAERLLFFASLPPVATETRMKNSIILPKLAQLCCNLNTLFEGKEAAPPSFSHTNGCGRFIFTAYWLDKANREPGDLIGVTIEYQEPLSLRLLRALKDAPLPPVQKEVALLVAQGVSTDKIGEQLHIKYTTVKDHIRKIFDKLDIHRREDLLPKLLANENIDNLYR